MLYRSIIFAMRMANKIPFTAPTEPFSMSTWALVTIQVLFIAKVAKAMLDPTHLSGNECGNPPCSAGMCV